MGIFFSIFVCSPYLAALLTTIFYVAGFGRIRVCLACWLTAVLHSVAWYFGYGNEELLFFTVPAMFVFSIISIILGAIEAMSSYDTWSRARNKVREPSFLTPNNIIVDWTDEPMIDKARRLLAIHQSAKWMYVESLDSNPTAENVLRVLNEFGLNAVLYAQKFPVMQVNEVVLIALQDIRIFPGYDTVWFVSDPSLLQSPPPVRLEVASYEKGELPAQREGRPGNPWLQLADWMDNSGVQFGLADSSILVSVSKLDSKDDSHP